MSSTYQAHIDSCTKSIVVNGTNQISVNVIFTNTQSDIYQNEIFCEFGEKSFYQLISDTTPQQFSFTIPVDWLNEITDSPLGTGKIELNCVNMNTGKCEYTETKNFTVYVPEEYKPEISKMEVKIRDIRNSIVDYALYGLTFPEINAIVTAHSTSPIKKYQITGGGVIVERDFSNTDYSDGYNFSAYGTVIKTWSNTKFTLTVEDARGRTASITSEDFYVQPYTRPLVNSLSAYRTDENGLVKADGGYIKVTINGGMSSIKNSNDEELNTIRCYVDWREVNGSYTHFTEITNKEPYIFKANKDSNFEIKCELRDMYMTTVASCKVLGESADFNIADGGGGAAVGTKATKGYFDVAYNSRFQNGISAKEKITADKGLVSNGKESRGDFLTFGYAERLLTYSTPSGMTYWGDFNDCTFVGVWGVYSDKDVSLSEYKRVLNAPCEKAGTLRVYYATGNISEDATELYLMQEYVVRDGSAVYRRCLSKLRDSSDVEWPTNWTFGDWYCYSGTKV